MSSLALKLLQGMKDVNISLASDLTHAAEFSGTTNTGSYLLNAAISSSMYGGIQDNKISFFAGLSATYKTYFVLQLAAQFLKDNPTGIVIWYDSEAATNASMMNSRGLDTDRVIRPEVYSIEELRNHVCEFLDNYLKTVKPEQRDENRVMIVIDSVSAFPSELEREHIKEKKMSGTPAMIRAQAWKGSFRNFILPLANARIPMVCAAHAAIDMARSTSKYQIMKETGTGDSMRFFSSVGIMLSKAKLTEGEGEAKDQIGNIITCKIDKSRFTKEGKRIKVKFTFEDGLDPYYGLVDFAIDVGIFKKGAKHVELPDGSKEFQSRIEKNPTKYFTPEIMEKLEAAARDYFKLGEENERPNSTEPS